MSCTKPEYIIKYCQQHYGSGYKGDPLLTLIGVEANVVAQARLVCTDRFKEQSNPIRTVCPHLTQFSFEFTGKPGRGIAWNPETLMIKATKILPLSDQARARRGPPGRRGSHCRHRDTHFVAGSVRSRDKQARVRVGAALHEGWRAGAAVTLVTSRCAAAGHRDDSSFPLSRAPGAA